MGLTIDELRNPYDLQIMAQAREEGRAESRRETLRFSVIELLEAHFGKVPTKIKRRIENMKDEARLHQAIRLAVTAATLEEFAEKA